MSSGSSPFDDIEQLFDRMAEQFETLEPTDLGVPAGPVPVDVVDEGDAFAVVADLPGYDGEDIDVTVPAARTVRVAATRETRADSETVRSERRESVERSVSLPAAVEAEETTATYDDGVLEIRLPKRRSEDGVSVPVN